MKSSFCLGLFAGAALAFSGCSKASSGTPSYGDPIGIRLDGDDKTPSLTVAVAATKGRDLVPAVTALGTAFHSASRTCPELTPLATAQTLRLRMAIEKGKFAAPSNASDEPVAVCVTKALEGKSIFPEATERLDILAEFHMDLPRAP